MTLILARQPKQERIMLLTKRLQTRPSGGREQLSKLNYDVLREIYGTDLVLYELPTTRKKGPMSIASALKGHIDGLDKQTIFDALSAVRRNRVTRVFVDGSNLGELTRQLRRELPRIKIYSFFHNVESRFFLGALRDLKTLRALAIFTANYLAERKSVQHSDEIICLSNRDSQLLGRIYGRKATHIAPLSLEDISSQDAISYPTMVPEKFALFVGGAFYANISGIKWFAKNVAPHLELKICVVGRGFEDLRNELEANANIKVIGSVDNLAHWYRAAHFVIAPIFDGSGMKTKVAEALMFGKKIIGTLEAFSGYEEISAKAGWTCQAADEFIRTIGEAAKLPLIPLDSELRQLYEQKYSFLAQRARLDKILNPFS